MFDQTCIKECFQEVEVEEFYWQEAPTEEDMEAMFLEAIKEDMLCAACAYEDEPIEDHVYDGDGDEDDSDWGEFEENY